MDDLRVSLPLKDLLELVKCLDGMDKRDKELSDLRRDVEATKRLVQDCMTVIGDLRREIRKVLR